MVSDLLVNQCSKYPWIVARYTVSLVHGCTATTECLLRRECMQVAPKRIVYPNDYQYLPKW